MTMSNLSEIPPSRSESDDRASSPENSHKRQKTSGSDFEAQDFKAAFKFFKSLKNPTLEFLNSLKFPVIISSQESDLCKCRAQNAVESIESEKDFEELGLIPFREWKIKELIHCPGGIIISNPFTKSSQQRWMQRALLDYPPVSEYVSNLDPEWNQKQSQSRAEIDWWKRKEENKLENAPIWKLRWMTLGYHHDWDTKVYSEEKRTKFPEDLAKLCRIFADFLGFKEFSPEAAIVNYYHLNSTLSAHQDVSEPYKDAPLFSISFGQPAVFLIGPSKSEWPNAVIVQSGDVFVMSGKCRMDFHAVPKIFCDSGLSPFFDENDKDLNCYLRSSRINFNVRQVLKPGATKLELSIK